MEINEITGMKLEPGMMLVYSSNGTLSDEDKRILYEDLDIQARNALSMDDTGMLPVGTIIIDPGDKLELLRYEDKRCDKCEHWSEPGYDEGCGECSGLDIYTGNGLDGVYIVKPDFHCGNFKEEK